VKEFKTIWFETLNLWAITAILTEFALETHRVGFEDEITPVDRVLVKLFNHTER
jgi:hypothetical protein